MYKVGLFSMTDVSKLVM